MNGAKQFHPIETAAGTKPLVAAAYDAIASACETMIVVLGHRAEEVAELLEGRDFTAVLSDPDAPMFASVRVGLLTAQRVDAQAAVLLHPADHPQVAPATLGALCREHASTPDCALLPTYSDRGGHPVLIPPAVIQQILPSECPAGLGEFWKEHPDRCRRVPVDDPVIVEDIDTAE